VNTILIVDTDSAIRLLYSNELSEEGYDVITCGNAALLMELIHRRNPDLVVMEVLLGNVNGLDLLQDISLAYRDLPVILCTSSPAFREDLRSLAASGFVVKSSKVKELKTAVKHVLKRKNSIAHLQQPMAQLSVSQKAVQ
jgi:DNA-binding NtrC family response regulator